MRDIKHYFTDLSKDCDNVYKHECNAINNINNIEKNKELRIRKEHCEEKGVLDHKSDFLRQESVQRSTKLINKKKYSPKNFLNKKKSCNSLKILDKRKTQIIVQSNKDYELIQSDEMVSKNNEFIQTNTSNNLLKFFSKADISTNQKHNDSKVLVQAEVHRPQNFEVSINSTNEKTKEKKDIDIDIKHSQEADRIHFIPSNELISFDKSEQIKLTKPENKIKWSLKIQLQSNIGSTGLELFDETDEIYTPLSKEQRINLKKSDKIPKVLLPIKKKIKNSSNLNDPNNENNKVDLTINNEASLKTDVQKKLDISNNYTKLMKTNLIENKEAKSLQTEENSLKRKSKAKLAPLFIKKIKPNSESLIARSLFLQTDLNEYNCNSKNEKQIIIENLLYFPKVSHVNQLPHNCSKTDQLLNVTIKNIKKLDLLFDFCNMREILQYENLSDISENLSLCEDSNIETVVSEIELHCLDAQNIWKSIKRISNFGNFKYTIHNRQKHCNKKSINISNDSTKSKQNSRQWIDKYKPISSMEVVGNEEAAKKLKSWLHTWNSFKIIEDCSSSDEFYTSDCSMSSNAENNQVAVLAGPHGSGKSASVYAVAQELGYKVLEINASSKRHGKKLFKEFDEATKSHRVKKSNMRNVFDSLPKEAKISQNSLILLEDIDLVFEEDDGFISAAFQLACNSKRPIVMTLRDTCSHLSKIAPHRCEINFQTVTGSKAIALLQLIALAETGYKLPQTYLLALCKSGDLRQGLNQLQYLLLPGKQSIPRTCLSLDNFSLKDTQTRIYKSVIKSSKKRKSLGCNMKIIENDVCVLLSQLNKFTLISSLIESQDSTSSLNLKSEPSTSSVEDSRLYSSLENMNLEIGTWLSNAVLKYVSKDSKNLNKVNIHRQTLIKKETNNDVDLILSEITSNVLDRQVLALDYLSSIRTICRAEEIRNQFNNKRGNRFFHYLQNSKFLNGSTKCNNILLKASKIFEQKASSAES